MTRRLTAFTPVAGSPTELAAAFEGELFPEARASGPDVRIARIGAAGFEREVDLHIGVAWHTLSGIWRPLTWVPREQDNDLAPLHRMLPTFVGEIGLVRAETTLALDGVYAPPMRWAGDLVDALALRRVAQATAQHLLADVARALELATRASADT